MTLKRQVPLKLMMSLIIITQPMSYSYGNYVRHHNCKNVYGFDFIKKDGPIIDRKEISKKTM